MKYVLALDQSTSATKAILYDVAGKLIDKVSKDHQQCYPQPGWVEHNAEEIWQNVLHVISSLVEKNSDLITDTVCLSITNQRETFLVFDKETGKPLYNAIVWQCRRGDEICANLSKEGHDDLIRKKTGLKIDTYFSASKLKWLIQNQPNIKQKLLNGEALIGTIDTYLIYRLTKGKVFTTDYTNASRTLLYDIQSLKWSEKLCELFEVPLQALPEVLESSAQFGETSLSNLSLPICGVIGDSQASLFAQRCYSEGMAKITFGTGSSLLLNIGEQLNYTESGAVSTIGWVHDKKPAYAFEGIISYAAATISWLQNQLGLINDPKETEAIALSIKDNGGVYLVPAFAGLSAPYWNSSAKAAIFGMTAYSTRDHIVRAALESISYQIRDILDMMKKDAGVDLKRVYCDGGPTTNSFIMQFTADITGLELYVANTFELSPMGAALFGALGMKIYSSLEELAKLPSDFKIYRPEMPQEQVQKNYDGWLNAVERLIR
ncbi:glycerol kinase GlpK [bacterium]|nr:glycerol kinase GlpK [bacterium]